MATDVPSNAPSAFFSYSRADSDFALKLAEDLKAAGANVWIDQLDIDPGTPWDGAVEHALRNAPLMLVILSTVSVASANVRDEISYALDRQKRIIPVLVSDCDIPIRLARLQHIDLRTDYARGLSLLLKSLGVEAHAPAPAPVDATVAKANAEQGEVNRKAAHERGYREAMKQQSVVAEQVHTEPTPQPAAVAPVVISARFPSWGRLAGGVGGALIIIALLYLALSPSRRRAAENQPPASQPKSSSEASSTPSSSFGNGLGPIHLGMTPEQVNLITAQPISTAWSSLPVASEFHTAEVRYFWVYLNKLPTTGASAALYDALPSFHPCWRGQSYITFLFTQQKLIRISVRLYPDCVQRNSILRDFADRYSIPTNFGPTERVPFQEVLDNTTVAGHVDSDAASIEVFTNGSPAP